MNMNPSLDEIIEKSLDRSLGSEGFDVICVRASGTAPDGSRSYIIEVKERVKAEAPLPTLLDGIDHEEAKLYSPAGQWNVPYLEKNAEVLMEAGEHTLAKNVWKTILKSGQRMGRAHLGYGRCLEAERKIDEAIDAFQESIAYQPTAEAYRRIVMLLLKQGKEATAVEAMERALYLKDLTEAQRHEFHFTCGNSLTRLGKTEAAENHFKKALSLKPSDDEVQCNLGTLQARAGNLEGAARSYRDAVGANPSNAIAWYGLGLVLREIGRSDEANQAFARTLQIDPAQPMAISHLIQTAYESGRCETTERIVSAYAECSPFSASLLYALSGLQIRLHRRVDARLTLERILAIQPEHEEARDLLSRVKEDATWAKIRNRAKG